MKDRNDFASEEEFYNSLTDEEKKAYDEMEEMSYEELKNLETGALRKFLSKFPEEALDTALDAHEIARKRDSAETGSEWHDLNEEYEKKQQELIHAVIGHRDRSRTDDEFDELETKVLELHPEMKRDPNSMN